MGAKFQDFKVTVYLQGCLARKRCSASSLSYRYLNPYIKLKLMELAIKMYRAFWNKINCRILHNHWMPAPESPFESYKSKWILFSANLILLLVSIHHAIKKRVCVLPYSIEVKKITEHFRNRIQTQFLWFLCLTNNCPNLCEIKRIPVYQIRDNRIYGIGNSRESHALLFYDNCK